MNALLKEACSGNAPLLGIHLSIQAPTLIELCGHLGFKWVFLDAEHQPLGPQNCVELIRAADLAGMACVVRVPDIDRSLIEGFLDLGVLGIIAPIVSPSDDVRDLVAATKFAPAGRRGAASRSRAAHYGLKECPAQYYQRANSTILIGALIESQHGLEALQTIAANPSLDCIAVGASDLGLSMALPDGKENPAVRGLIDEARVRIKQAGKPQIAVVSTVEEARQVGAHGARLIAVSDIALLARGASAFTDAAGPR